MWLSTRLSLLQIGLLGHYLARLDSHGYLVLMDTNYCYSGLTGVIRTHYRVLHTCELLLLGNGLDFPGWNTHATIRSTGYHT